MSSKEDGNLTVTCQVDGHEQCSNIISMTNGGTQGVSQHFLKYHANLNVRIRALQVLSCCVWAFFSFRVFLLSITDWSCSDVLILYSSSQFLWNSSIMCSEPGKLVIDSHVSSLSRAKSRHPIWNSTPFFVIRLSLTSRTKYCVLLFDFSKTFLLVRVT